MKKSQRYAPVMLTEEQMRALARAIQGQRKEPPTDSEIDKIFRWADNIVLNQAMLENVLAGKMDVHWLVGEKEPSFRITAEGERDVEERLLESKERRS